jgi:hypothetical protein
MLYATPEISNCMLSVSVKIKKPNSSLSHCYTIYLIESGTAFELHKMKKITHVMIVYITSTNKNIQEFILLNSLPVILSGVNPLILRVYARIIPIMTTMEFRDIEIIHNIFRISLCAAEDFLHPPSKSFSFCIKKIHSFYENKTQS